MRSAAPARPPSPWGLLLTLGSTGLAHLSSLCFPRNFLFCLAKPSSSQRTGRILFVAHEMDKAYIRRMDKAYIRRGRCDWSRHAFGVEPAPEAAVLNKRWSGDSSTCLASALCPGLDLIVAQTLDCLIHLGSHPLSVHRLRVSFLTLNSVYVCEGCHSKIQQTGWLPPQKQIFSQPWKLEVQDQGVGRFESSRSLFP